MNNNYQLQKRDDLHMSLGEILSEYRKKQKLTQPALADKLKAYGINISYKAVSKWETNACQPNIYTFFSICKILNINMHTTKVLHWFLLKIAQEEQVNSIICKIFKRA